MRQGTYLNVILTVNAILLAGVIWTQVARQPVLAQTATAQQPTAPGVGIPNAADQRQKMIEVLRDLKSSVDSMKASIATGKFKVEVANPDQLRKVEVTNISDLKR